jgi:4-amino-4-deoxy-L-arabinose transferase-like glycosyltransferase
MMIGWLDRRLARVGDLGWLSFLSVAATVAAPWYVAVSLRCPEFAGYFFWLHNVVRFTAPFDHAKPIWFYLPQLAMGLLPWSLLLIPLMRLLGRRRWSVASRRPGALGFTILAAAWGLLFFSLAGSKRAVYLVPVLPPLALALGCYLDLALPRRRLAMSWGWLVRHRSALAWRTALVGLAIGLGGGGLALLAGVGQPGRIALLTFGSAAGLIALIRHERRARWLTAGAVTFLVLWTATHDLLPDYARRFSLKRAARASLAVAHPPAAIYSCPQAQDAASFYLRRDDVRSFTPQTRFQVMADLYRRPDAVVFVKTADVKDLLAMLPPGLEFTAAASDARVTVGRVGPRREAAVVGYARAANIGASSAR